MQIILKYAYAFVIPSSERYKEFWDTGTCMYVIFFESSITVC
jgi:hypothetical protein